MNHTTCKSCGKLYKYAKALMKHEQQCQTKNVTIKPINTPAFFEQIEQSKEMSIESDEMILEGGEVEEYQIEE